MLIDVKGKYGKFLKLGIQTNPGKTIRRALKVAKLWAPKNAKSFNMEFFNTDYHGTKNVDNDTGYATIKVYYFTAKTEGEYDI